MQGGQLNGCIGTLYDPNHYNWYSYRNNCGQALYLRFCSQNNPSTCGALTLASGATGSTGETQTEVNALGEYVVAACTADHHPVTPTGATWIAGLQFCCVP